MREYIDAFKRFATVLLLVPLFISGIAHSQGLSDAQRQLFRENINYFNADACSVSSGSSITTSGTGPVYIMGDSITHLAESTYKKQFSGGGWTPTVQGLDSRHIVDSPPSPSGLGQIQQDADKNVIGKAKAIVIALGTNDSSESATTIKNNVAKLMDQLKSEDTNYAPIYWVNILDTRSDADTKKTNQAIKDGVGTDAAVIDWYSEATDKADLSSFAGGVHPTKQKDIDLLVNLVYSTVNGTRNGATPIAAGDCVCDTGSTALTGNSNEEKTWNYFKSKGLSDKQVAGIMGNMVDESHFDPEIMQIGGRSKDPYDAKNLGWGIIQWSGNGDSRSTGDKVTKDYKESGVQGPVYELATQLDMVWQHMHNHPVVTQPFDLGYYKTLSDEKVAAEYFRAQIEGGANSAAREQAATKMLNKYGGKGDVASSSGSAGSGCPASNSSSPDCASANGTAKILCEAKKYDPVDYVWSGGHAGGSAYHSGCPTIKSNDTKCGLDCSGLVSVAVYDAFKGDGRLAWDTNSLRSDTAHWKQVPFSQVQAGDVIEPESSHVEIVDHVTGSKVFTFGAHDPNRPQPKQVSPTTYINAPSYQYYHYIGPGSSS